MQVKRYRLLVYYHPDASDAAADQRRIVSQVAAECSTEDSPLVVGAVT
ncbi:MAG: hypothetical protein ACYC4L_04220 [Chloroflexota bacterium]